MNVLLGEIIIGLGFIFLAIGVAAQLKNKGFYKRILLGSIIDSAAVITIFVGVMIRQGFNGFTLKILVILIIMLAISPLATHKLTRSAHLSHLGEKNDD